ncbi:hypothetical protein D3C86_1922890 [compost metagenome]
MNIRNDVARVPRVSEEALDQFVEGHGFWTGDLDRAIERLRKRDLGQHCRHVVGGNGLDQRRRQANLVANGGRLSNTAYELEELCGAQ